MFFGQKIQIKKPFKIVSNQNQNEYSTFQISNAALDLTFSVNLFIYSKTAALYLKTGDKEILISQLNLNIPQSTLNILIDLKNQIELIAKNGDIHVCGFLHNKNQLFQQNKTLISNQVINTNKKINQLSRQTFEENSKSLLQIQSQSNLKQVITKNDQNNSTVQSQPALRQSSRLSSRRTTSSIITQVKLQNKKQSEKQSKKQKMNTKKQEKSPLLQNGRFSLKALLQNADDEDQDSDEEFSEPDQQSQSEDDSQFSEDFEGKDEEIMKKQKSTTKKQIIEQKQEKKSIQKVGNQMKQQETKEGQKQSKKLSKNQEVNLKPQIQITQEESDEKRQFNTEQFQQKWPENSQSELEREENQIQKKIQSLASKIKCPTKKPTI